MLMVPATACGLRLSHPFLVVVMSDITDISGDWIHRLPNIVP